jgi:1,4-dihydroxy-2-naphthoate octaprenyltransferase
MTPKQTALLHVAKLIALAVVIGFFVNIAFTYFTVGEIGIGFCVGMLVYMIKMYYDLALSQAEHLEALNKIDRTKG